MTPVCILGWGADPGPAGWIMVACYLATTVLCARALWAARIGSRLALEHEGPDRRATARPGAYHASAAFWGLMVILCLLLGFNKQLDFQTWLTNLGRRSAEAQGWYDRRREVQVAFVICTAGLALLGLGVVLFLTRELLPRHVLAFGGVAVLAAYVMLRASSFHDVDDLMDRSVAGIRLGWVMELVGVVCVAVCAWRNSAWLGWWGRRAAGPAHP